MSYVHSFDRALKSRIGEGGISDAAYEEQLGRTTGALAALRTGYEKKSLALLRVPEQTDDLAAVETAAVRLRRFGDIVFLGTGGSSLGGQAVAQLSDYAVPMLGTQRERPRVHFLDNLDPLTFDRVLQRLPLAETAFVAISKSGGTAETLMQSMAVLAALDAADRGGKIAEQFFGLSEPPYRGRNNGLRALLEPRGCAFLDHDTGVGGRFSVLTNVGLLPARVLGLDAKAIRAGAKETLAAVLNTSSPDRVPAAQGAALSAAAAAEGKMIRVMFAYADRLERFAKWWVQLWAESLGKQGRGAAPLAALGPVDQHSQLQLWLDGPRDKLFTVITTEVAGTGPRMEMPLAEAAGEPDLGGKTIGDLVAAQGRATADTLARNGRPSRGIHVEKLDERTLGALFMHFMLETIVAAHLLDIDPYDQPAVEEGKILAKHYLVGKA